MSSVNETSGITGAAASIMDRRTDIITTIHGMTRFITPTTILGAGLTGKAVS
jgi:hypothetical protein